MYLGRLIELPPRLVKLARDYGAEIGVSYKERRGDLAHRLVHDVSPREAVEIYTKARMAEFIFCLAAGLDPLKDLEQRVGRKGTPKAGHAYDTIVGGWKVDVKYADWNKRYLVWPLNRNDDYDDFDFDYLALIKLYGNAGAYAGAVSKRYFRDFHWTAHKGGPLKPGTWYLHEEELSGVIGRQADPNGWAGGDQY